MGHELVRNLSSTDMLPAVALAAGAAAAAQAATLTASPASSSEPMLSLNVAWSGIEGAQSNDWVAAYCPGADVSAFGTWTYVTACDSWATGSCASLPLGLLSYTSYECNVEVRYYRDPSPYTLIGTSNAVNWTAPAASFSEVHVAYGTSPQHEATLSVTSPDAAHPVMVQVGTQSGAYTLNFTSAEPITYYANDTCGDTSSGWKFPGFFYHTLLYGLQPATTYYVRPVQGGVVGQELSFVTAKAPSAAAQLKFATYGDMYISGGTGAVDTAARVSARVPELDFVLHVGDLGYGLGSVAVWQDWLGLIQTVTGGARSDGKALPYMVSIGNHEYCHAGTDSSKDPSGYPSSLAAAGFSWYNGGDDSNGECGVPTSRRFRTPATGNGVFWYSFNAGPAHIAVLSSEHDPSPSAPMGAWLLADLAAVDRSVTPWLLVFIHRPLYETEQYEGDYLMAAGLRGLMEEYLLRFGVNAVIAGHYHAYMRTCPLVNGTCVTQAQGDGPRGIVHYTTGAAGMSLDDPAGLYPSTYVDKYIQGRYGYSVVTIANATALHLEFHDNEDDSVTDDAWIYQ